MRERIEQSLARSHCRRTRPLSVACAQGESASCAAEQTRSRIGLAGRGGSSHGDRMWSMFMMWQKGVVAPVPSSFLVKVLRQRAQLFFRNMSVCALREFFQGERSVVRANQPRHSVAERLHDLSELAVFAFV